MEEKKIIVLTDIGKFGPPTKEEMEFLQAALAELLPEMPSNVTIEIQKDD